MTHPHPTWTKYHIDFQWAWNLEDHFRIDLFNLDATVGHNCVHLRLLWADFVWLRNFDLYRRPKNALPSRFYWCCMVSLGACHYDLYDAHNSNGDFLRGAICPKETDVSQCALKKGLVLGYQKRAKASRRKTTSARRFTTIWPTTGLSQLVRCHGPPAALPLPIFCRHRRWRL